MAGQAAIEGEALRVYSRKRVASNAAGLAMGGEASSRGEAAWRCWACIAPRPFRRVPPSERPVAAEAVSMKHAAAALSAPAKSGIDV